MVAGLETTGAEVGGGTTGLPTDKNKQMKKVKTALFTSADEMKSIIYMYFTKLSATFLQRMEII